MNDSPLSHEAITITIQTLVELDRLHERFFNERLEEELRTTRKFGDGEAFEAANQAFRAFITMSPIGNHAGIRMNTSSFICGMQLIGLDNEAKHAIDSIPSDDTNTAQ